MSRPLRLSLALVLALVAGLAAGYGFDRIGVRVAMESDSQAGPWMLRLTPLAALAAFAMVYALGRGRALRLWFWVIGAAVVFGARWVAVGIMATGAPVPLALGLALAVVIGAALALAVRDMRHG